MSGRSGGVWYPNTLPGGRKEVAAAGTPEPLVSTSTSCKTIVVQALPDNTGNIIVGDENIVVTSGSESGGVVLGAAESFGFDIDDVSRVYIDAENNDEGATFIYFN